MIDAYRVVVAKVISGKRRINNSQTAHLLILIRPYAAIRHEIAKTPSGGMADMTKTTSWAIPAIT